MSLDAASLKQLRKRLPRKYIKPLLRKLGARGKRLSDSYVSQVINGARHDEDILKAAALVAHEHQAAIAELKLQARGGRKTA